MTPAGGVWVLWPRTAITLENYERVHDGMTRAEVETILGGPPRDETDGRITAGLSPGVVIWIGPDHTIYLWFSADDRVKNRSIERHSYGYENPAKMVSRWLRL